MLADDACAKNWAPDLHLPGDSHPGTPLGVGWSTQCFGHEAPPFVTHRQLRLRLAPTLVIVPVLPVALAVEVLVPQAGGLTAASATHQQKRARDIPKPWLITRFRLCPILTVVVHTRSPRLIRRAASLARWSAALAP